MTDDIRAALVLALETLENVQGNINPERGYAEELEAEVTAALEQIRATITKANCQVTVLGEQHD